ncbi:MAG: Uma2 family endonuclease [Pyrinomonadaceae bacterium]|nr:Uma2 family endonuclease [Pyrinomonadaceae bacterium]
MGLAKLKPYLSVENYLIGENDGEIRHEYIYGEVYAMAGSSDRHNRISFNCAKKIDGKLNPEGKCQVFMTDMKLQADSETFYYPDIFVACDKPDRYFRREPILIIEVLSPSTESIDKREKLKVYRQIPTLQEYAIIAQDKMSVEFHRKNEDGVWIKEMFNSAEEIIEFNSVELNIFLSEIYRGVDFQEI